MQNDLWTHRDETVGDIDLTSFKVEALDGDIGKIDEATYEAGRSFIVVDTGPWIFGKKVMLPAGVIDRIDTENERVVVGRTKDEIKNAPAYDPELALDDEYHGNLSAHYGAPTAGARRDDTF